MFMGFEFKKFSVFVEICGETGIFSGEGCQKILHLKFSLLVKGVKVHTKHRVVCLGVALAYRMYKVSSRRMS